MKIVKMIVEIIHIFLENLIKEDDFEQDFRRNFSEHYSHSKNIRNKYI